MGMLSYILKVMENCYVLFLKQKHILLHNNLQMTTLVCVTVDLIEGIRFAQQNTSHVLQYLRVEVGSVSATQFCFSPLHFTERHILSNVCGEALESGT
jgi:hypothetical protein